MTKWVCRLVDVMGWERWMSRMPERSPTYDGNVMEYEVDHWDFAPTGRVCLFDTRLEALTALQPHRGMKDDHGVRLEMWVERVEDLPAWEAAIKLVDSDDE